MMNDFVSDALSSKNTPKLTAKDARTVRHPTNATIDLDNVLRPKPLTRKPKSGNNGINQTKFIIILFFLTYSKTIDLALLPL
jgi:hypothetical protein